MAAKGDGGTLRLTPEVDAAMPTEATPLEDEASAIRAALARHRKLTHAAESLGMNRHQLARLMTKYGLREA